MSDNLFIGSEARDKIMAGVKKVANAVGATMGTGGQNSLLETIERPGFIPTNDGDFIIQHIKLADPLEEMGRKIMAEAVSRANKVSGDGSSTTAVLTASILEEGQKFINSRSGERFAGDCGHKNEDGSICIVQNCGIHIKKENVVSPMEIKLSLEECIPIIEESIKSQTKKVSLENVSAVATTSAEDEKIGNKIQEIYQKIGKDGIIYWDVSKTAEDSYSIGTGLSVSGSTYVSPYMCDVDEKTGAFLSTVRIKNPVIILAKQKIITSQEFNDLFYSLNNQNKKDVVVFCEEIEFPAIANIIKTRIERGFRVVVVKMPILWRDEWWQDLAKTSGATIIDSVLGLNNIKEEHIGTFDSILITKEDVFIDGIKDISQHIKELESEGSDESKLRASRLNTKTARYFVGAYSESALAYRRLKVEDAINAAYEALHHGIVPGGGVALLNASKMLPDTIGGDILRDALKAPIKWILGNSGREYSEEYGGKIGFNTKTMKKSDMVKDNVLDPSSIVINSMKNAIGVAASILTVGSVVIFPRDGNEAKNVL